MPLRVDRVGQGILIKPPPDYVIDIVIISNCISIVFLKEFKVLHIVFGV